MYSFITNIQNKIFYEIQIFIFKKSEILFKTMKQFKVVNTFKTNYFNFFSYKTDEFSLEFDYFKMYKTLG